MSVEICNNQQLLGESKAMCPKTYKIIPTKMTLQYSNDKSCSTDVCVEDEIPNLNNCRDNYCDLRTNYNLFSTKCHNYSFNGLQFSYECIPPSVFTGK